MSVSLSDYNPAQAEDRNSFDTVPEGLYKAMIVGSQKKATKAGTGHYLELKWQIIEGPHQGSVLTSRINLWNPNEKAVNIARSELKQIYGAIGKGVAVINDSQELHNIPAMLKVSVTDADTNGNHWNEIKRYDPCQAKKVEENPSQGLDNENPWS